MLRVRIDTANLERFINPFKTRVAAATATTAARALNNLGDRAIGEIARTVASQSGMDQETVRKALIIQRATPQNLSYRIDASRVMVDSPTGSRPFHRRPDGYFHPDDLVNIVTQGDEDVCPICVEARENGPYTIEEVRAMGARSNPFGAGGSTLGGRTHLLHKSCRCGVAEHRLRRSLPVEMRVGRGAAEQSRITMRGLAQALLAESKGRLTAR